MEANGFVFGIPNWWCMLNKELFKYTRAHRQCRESDNSDAMFWEGGGNTTLSPAALLAPQTRQQYGELSSST